MVDQGLIVAAPGALTADNADSRFEISDFRTPKPESRAPNADSPAPQGADIGVAERRLGARASCPLWRERPAP
jgi:hypothetical protein